MADPRAIILRAREHAAAGRPAQARAALARVLQATPGEPLANVEMARLLLRDGPSQHPAVRFHLDRALRSASRDPAFLCEVGKMLMQTGERAGALTVFADAARAAPTSPVPRGALAALHMLEGRFASAVRECREGLTHTPGQPDLANTCGMALLSMGRAREALTALRAAAAAGPERLMIHSNLALATNYCPDLAAHDSLEIHLAYARALDAAIPALSPPPPCAKAERLTIAFLSPDFIGHSVEYFVRPVLTHLDRARFRVVCLSTAPDRPGEENRRPPCDAWLDVSALGIDRLVEAIRAERCDILVELSGHMMGNRLPVLRRRPAPLQITYLGYPNTTGMAEVDARFVDSTTDPAPEADAAATERLVRLDPCFLSYSAAADAPPVAARDARSPLIFGSFNALSKLSDGVVALWTRVVGSVPGSRLLLKAAGLVEDEVRSDVAARFEAAGLDPGRLDFAPWTGGHAEHMGLYGRVDIALDPFPYNGTTTTAEALWMGVPVVTLAGDRHAGRVGLSLLTAAGLPELIARSPDEYGAIATRLAGDRAALAGFRTSLRDRIAHSALCDGPALARRFAQAVEALWHERCREQAGAG